MKFTTHLFIFTILLSPIVLFASTVPEYSPLVGLPGLNGEPLTASSDFNSLIDALYAIAIAIAALLAVIKVIIAGVKWMLTDIVTSKEEAKKDIKGALLGLLIVLSAVLILTVINPNLVNVDLSKTVMGENFVPIPPPTPRTAHEICSGRGGIIVTCPHPHPTGTGCKLPGFSWERTCKPDIVNNCPVGTTCICERYSGVYDCSLAEDFCNLSGGTATTASGGTRINCI